ncbi:3-carboxy-cis,cis-muconate cycloisomerase [Nocardiopsis mangrovi]|uniref:3-carboxy-cis,cis-muconate cycloisomerase n=1 Tax=Nocardiopsis mangrovi TaxID=1179818 RepID=A0ABV9E8M7_9ACTN
MNAPPDTGLLSPVRAGTPVEEAVADTAWAQAMLDAESALARAQASLGTVPRSAAAAITRAARADRIDVRAVAVSARENANPVVALVRELTRVVAADDPGAAEYVHRGSTSQDVLDTGAMLVARRALELIGDDLERSAEALAALAGRHRDTAMAGRTLATQAVPTTFGLKAAGWHRLVSDARDRVERVRLSGLPVSLGGAAGTLAGYLEHARCAGSEEDGGATGFYLDRLVEAFARETGLARQDLPWHALRTPVADLAAVLGFTCGALGKIAVDVLTLSRTEIAEVAEPGPQGRGASSAMPHKRNPVLATMIRSAALQVPVLAAGLTQCLTADDERSAGAWHAEWALLREGLRLTGGAAHTAVELAGGLAARPERMADNLRPAAAAVTSERVAAVLTPHLGRADARALAARCAAESARSGRPMPDLLAREAAVAREFSRARLAELCDPAQYTGAAGWLVDRAIGDAATGPAGLRDPAPR